MSCKLVKRYCAGSTSFNGTTSTIVTDITANTAFTSGFVLHGWIKPRSVGETRGNIFDKSIADGGDDGFKLGFLTTKCLSFRCNVGTEVNSANGSINYYRWQHVITHVSANATVSHYINGVLSGTPAATGALSGITTSNPLTFGNRSTATDRTFDGNLAELGVISLAGRGDLTAEEIKALYTNSVKPTGNAHFFPLSDLPSTYLDTVGGATGTGTATTYSTDVPTQLPVAIDTEARSSVLFTGVASSGSNITVPDDASIKFTGSFTLAGEVKSGLTPGNDNPRLYSKFPNYYAYKRSATSSDLYVRVFDGTLSIDSLYIPNVFINQWVKWAFKFDTVNRVAYGYRNGLLVGKQSFPASFDPSLITSAQDLKIGCAEFSSISLLGNQKSFRIWNTALTDQQIRDLHFNNIVPYKDDPTKLVLNLTLNEGAGTIAYDSSGNGNNATISGATWSTNTPTKPRTLVTTPRTIAVNRTNITC